MGGSGAAGQRAATDTDGARRVAQAEGLAGPRPPSHAELKPNAEMGVEPTQGGVGAPAARAIHCEIIGVRTINEAIAELG